MFNSPLLDVAIGLVFIFLIYSLLITSVNEMIAMTLSLRARMLKNAIVERMLSTTIKDNRWISFLKGIKELFLEIGKIFTGRREKPEDEKKIGDKFFDHPLIKNYGSSRIFDLPSYIPANSFSSVLIDVLKEEFDNKSKEITNSKFNHPANKESLESIEQNLSYSQDIIKIKELIDHYGNHYSQGKIPPISKIDKETWKILKLHHHESENDIEKFKKKIEVWFDDSMNRVSGWYKRQTQIMLFILGGLLALIFNIDTIGISNKLSIDKDARDKLVQLATQATEKYKDDPRVQHTVNSQGEIVVDTSRKFAEQNLKIYDEYRTEMSNRLKAFHNELNNSNDLLALGWGNYGREGNDATKWQKVCYVMGQCWDGKKILGLLITAFAICLGAPFWFDLLNKLVRLRATGRKEGTDTNSDIKAKNIQPPIIVVNNTPTGEQAVG